MTLFFFGRGLAVGGLIALVLAAAPAIIFALLPASAGEGFLATLAALLLVTVVPLAAVVASAGALLLLLAWLRRERG